MRSAGLRQYVTWAHRLVSSDVPITEKDTFTTELVCGDRKAGRALELEISTTPLRHLAPFDPIDEALTVADFTP